MNIEKSLSFVFAIGGCWFLFRTHSHFEHRIFQFFQKQSADAMQQRFVNRHESIESIKIANALTKIGFFSYKFKCANPFFKKLKHFNDLYCCEI